MVNLIGLSGKKRHGKNTVADIIQDLTSIEIPDYAIFKNGEWENMKGVSEWQQKSFANKLKEMCALLLGCKIEQLEDEEFKNSILWVHPNTGQNITPIYIMQQLGTEFGRTIHPDLWVDRLFVDYKEHISHDYLPPLNEGYPKWIITDVRFPNEANTIKERGGVVFRVFRPGQLEVFYKDSDFNPEDEDESDFSGNYYVQSIDGDRYTITQYRDGTGNKVSGDILEDLVFSESDKHLSEVALDSYEFDEIIINDGNIEDLTNKVKQILIKCKNYRVTWQYDKYTPEVKSKGENSTNIVERDVTTCFITNENKEIISQGVVKQFYKDNSNRNIARKESFSKAVSQISDRETRKYLWGEFKNKSPKCINC